MNKEILQYGIRALKSRHADIRRLKREHAPHLFGFRVWTSSWLLMDYFQQLGLRRGIRVMDIGCGWGLAGIYCAKEHAAVVTGVDEDSEVFPYLQVHARLNKVTITTMIKEFTGLTGCDMERTDMIIGADICFWDTMVATLTRLILTALGSGVQAVIIADPGRAPVRGTR